MHCWECLKHAVFPNIGKTNVFSRVMKLNIFHALYSCLTVEDSYEKEKKNE